MQHQRCTRLLAVLLSINASVSAATVLYAQTRQGIVYRSLDSGQTWVKLPAIANGLATTAALAVDPNNTDNLYSVYVWADRGSTVQDGVFRSTDGGQTWTETALRNINPPIAIDRSSTNIIYTNANNTGFYRSSDSGQSFQLSNPGTTSISVSVIQDVPTQPGTVYAVVVNNNSIYKSTDYGVTWTLVITNPFKSVFGGVITGIAVDPKSSNTLYLSANNAVCGNPQVACGLLKSTDGGSTWTTILADSLASVLVDSRNGNIYAGGYVNAGTPNASGEFIKSTDSGKTFTKVTKGFNNLGIAVYTDPESENILYAVQSRTAGSNSIPGAPKGGVYVSTDSGATWTLSPVDTSLASPNDQVLSFSALTITANVVTVHPPIKAVSAAGGRSDLFAPDSIVSAYGVDLANATAGADNPPGTMLAGASVSVTDSAGTTALSPLLYVSGVQINFVVPSGLAAGPATVTYNSGTLQQTQTVQLGPVAPGLFTFNANNLVAGSIIRVSGDGTQTAENLFQMDNAGNVVALPIDLGPSTDQVYLILYGTGFRAAGTSSTSVAFTSGTRQTVPDVLASYAGPQGAFLGLDQANVLIPRALAGAGTVSLILKAGNQASKTVNISIK